MNSLLRDSYFYHLPLFLRLLDYLLAISLHYVINQSENERTMALKVVMTNPLDNVFASTIEQIQVNKYLQVTKHLPVNTYPRVHHRASDHGWASSRDASRSSRTNP